MSTRTRNRPRGSGQSYTAQLRQRTAARQRRRARSWPTWLTSRRGPALVALAAEVGHLGAALAEWPGSPGRGVLHVLAAATLGLVAATVYFGHSRPVVVAGTGIGLALPVGWLVATVAGAPPFLAFPWGMAVLVAALEVAIAAWLAGPWARH
jgi:hypothetical protein